MVAANVNPNMSPEQSEASRMTWVTGSAILIAVTMIVLLVVDRLYNPDKFQIEQIEVRGQFVQVDSDQVRLSVENTLNGNYFSASLDDIERGLIEMPWVFSASVRRQWPSTLVVEVEEIQPIANWGDDQWLNATGDLVDRHPLDIKLPLLKGPQDMQQYVWKSFQPWHEMFASYGLNLERLEFDERELWYLTLSLTALALDRNAIPDHSIAGELNQKAEVTMIVDNTDATARIKRLINALNSQLIAEFPGMRSIDLRYPNGFAINWIKYPPESQKLTESQ